MLCRQLRRLILPMLLVVGVSGCHQPKVPSGSGSSARATATQPANSTPTHTRAIVFVHGIHGDPTGTWTGEGGSPYWPDLVRGDRTFSDADVYAIGYPTPYTGNRNDVTDIAKALSSNLTPIFDRHREVIFICHSLGGLIVEEMLVDQPKLAAQVPFVVFYATPHAGSFVASFTSAFAGDPLLRSMSSSGDNHYLLDLEARWRGGRLSTHRYCAYEMLKTRPLNLQAIVVGGAPGAAKELASFVGGIYVVDPYSATYGCDSNAPFTGIAADHIGIVKPTGSQDPIYILFKGYYQSNPPTVQPSNRVVHFDKVLCAFYGEAVQGSSAWNQDESCPVPDREHLDPDYHQAAFQCCGGGAGASLQGRSLPAGIELGVDGGHYWSVDFPHTPSRALWQGDSFVVHTYCGPEPAPGPGCNVKLKVVGHYRIVVPESEVK